MSARSPTSQPAVRHIIEDELLTDSGFPRERRRGAPARKFREPPAPRPIRSPCSSTVACCASRSGWISAASNSPTTCCAASCAGAATCGASARRAMRPSGCSPSSTSASSRRAARWCARARSPPSATVLAIAALAAAVLAYFSNQRAHRAERQAEETRAAAEQARGQAEHLLAYLTDDFASELETFGRMDVVADLAKRQIDYFKALPAALQQSDTLRNEARALVHYAIAMRIVGNPDAANAAATEGVVILERLRHGGDASEATLIALAKGLAVQSRVLYNQANPSAVPTAERAVALLKPVAEASQRLSRGARDLRTGARRLRLRARRNLARRQGGLAGPSPRAANGNRSRREGSLQHRNGRLLRGSRRAHQRNTCGLGGHSEDARRVAADAEQVADKVLAVRPVYLLALHAKGIVNLQLRQHGSE